MQGSSNPQILWPRWTIDTSMRCIWNGIRSRFTPDWGASSLWALTETERGYAQTEKMSGHRLQYGKISPVYVWAQSDCTLRSLAAGKYNEKDPAKYSKTPAKNVTQTAKVWHQSCVHSGEEYVASWHTKSLIFTWICTWELCKRRDWKHKHCPTHTHIAEDRLEAIRNATRTDRKLQSLIQIIHEGWPGGGNEYTDCTHLYTENFKRFSRQWKFKHKTSSPGHPQSNRMAESLVKTIKQLLKKAKAGKKDPYLSMLNQRNTPAQGINASPVQRLFSKRTRTLMPMHDNLLRPKVMQTREKQVENRKHQDE